MHHINKRHIMDKDGDEGDIEVDDVEEIDSA
jgi:hypothetical protein